MNKNYSEYLLKKTREDYNLMAESFSRARERIWDEMKFLFEDYLMPGDRVLDLGCGNGRFYELFKNKNIDYVGADNSKKLIEIARKRYPGVKFQTADALNLPFPNNHFNKVYCIAVLHHIPSKEIRLKVLTEIKRILKPEGLLILTVWNLWQKRKTRDLIFKFGLTKILRKLALRQAQGLDFKDILMEWEGAKNVYFHAFTEKELGNLVSEAGFKIKKRGEILVGGESALKSKWPNSNFFIVAKK